MCVQKPKRICTQDMVCSPRTVEGRRYTLSVSRFGQLALINGGNNGVFDREGGASDLVAPQETAAGVGGHGGGGGDPRRTSDAGGW